MNCRVGMTTDVGERKRYWQNQYPSLSNWQILGIYHTKTEAQQAENHFARQYGCISYAGGNGNARAIWSVYKFNY